jgi:hypothetical protein
MIAGIDQMSPKTRPKAEPLSSAGIVISAQRATTE